MWCSPLADYPSRAVVALPAMRISERGDVSDASEGVSSFREDNRVSAKMVQHPGMVQGKRTPETSQLSGSGGILGYSEAFICRGDR